MSLLQRVKQRLLREYNLHVRRDPYLVALRNWRRVNGDNTLRLNYPLDENSTVFDAGGYLGQWSEEIVRRYNPYVIVFEPVLEYFDILRAKFKNNPKVRVLNIGLADNTATLNMEVRQNSSSLFQSGSPANLQPVQIVDIYDVMRDQQVDSVELFKINIEGAEYALLRRMLETQIILKCKNIQVQFHDFFPGAIEARQQIRQELAKSHHLTYDYPFVWENWRRIE